MFMRLTVIAILVLGTVATSAREQERFAILEMASMNKEHFQGKPEYGFLDVLEGEKEASRAWLEISNSERRLRLRFEVYLDYTDSCKVRQIFSTTAHPSKPGWQMDLLIIDHDDNICDLKLRKLTGAQLLSYDWKRPEDPVRSLMRFGPFW